VAAGRKKPKFYKGTLANAGLGEAEYFLRKAAQNVDYALMALEGMDVDDALASVNDIGEKISLLLAGAGDLRDSFADAEASLLEEAEKKEAREEEDRRRKDGLQKDWVSHKDRRGSFVRPEVRGGSDVP
jgi:hypothetical protein